jgi:hypothetical protein
VPLARPWNAVAALPLLVWIGSCGDDRTGVPPVPAEIRLLSPATQSGTPGWPLPDSVIVEVLDAEGNALSGVPITWSTAVPGAKLGRMADTTNIAGRASAEWTLGWDEGNQSLSVVADQLAPVAVAASASIFHAASVTVGEGFACALTATGRAFCWGRNYEGQVGIGAVSNQVVSPTAVAGDLVFTALTASSTHACGLTATGVAYCWGGNSAGETGTGTFGPSVAAPTAVQTSLRFTRLSAEGTSNWSNSTCGLTATGEVWCWGYNELGKLGDGTTTNSAVPVRVLGDVTFTSVQTGFFHSCATAVSSGDLWCWGEQETDIGAFGSMPEGIYTTPVAVQPDFDFAQLSTGRNYTCGVTAGHAAFCWGTNWFGSLGTDPPTDATPDPLPVAGGHSFTKLSAAGFEGTHALTTDGVIYRWGSPGGDIAQPTPIPITQLRFTDMDSGSEPFVGATGSCGIAVNGGVYCMPEDDVVRGVPTAAAP